MNHRPSRFAPRFRLSTLLLLVAVAAGGLWWFIVRPRQFAERQTAAGRAAISDRDRVYFDFVFDDTVKDRLVTVLGDSRLTHWNDVRWIAFPDAKTIAAGAHDGTMIVWNREDGAILHGFYDLSTSCYAPDINRFFFSRKDGKLKSWAIGEKTPKDEGLDFSKTPGGSKCSPNGRYFLAQLGGGKQGAAIWDRETNKSFDVDGDFSALAFTPDSKAVVFLNVTTIREFDLATGELLATVPIPANKDGSRAYNYGAAFSDDGSRFYTSNASGRVTIYDWPKREVLHVISDAQGSIECLAADDNNNAVLTGGRSADYVRRIMEWQRAGDIKTRIVLHERTTALHSGPSGTAIGLVGGQIVDVNGASPGRLKGGPRIDAVCFAFSPTGNRIALGSRSGQIVVREIATWTRLQSWSAHEKRIRRLLWPRDDLLMSVAEDETVAAWDAESGNERFSTFGVSNITERALAFNAAKTRFTLRDPLNLRIYDSESFAEKETLPFVDVPLAVLGDVVFAQDGRMFAGGGASQIDIIDPKTRRVSASIGGPRIGDEVNLALSGDEQTIYAGSSPMLFAFDIKSATQLWSINPHGGRVNDIALHPKLPFLATCGGDGHVAFADSASGTVLKRLRLGPVRGDILQVDFSPDGELLAAAMSNGSVVVLRKPWE